MELDPELCLEILEAAQKIRARNSKLSPLELERKYNRWLRIQNGVMFTDLPKELSMQIHKWVIVSVCCEEADKVRQDKHKAKFLHCLHQINARWTNVIDVERFWIRHMQKRILPLRKTTVTIEISPNIQINVYAKETLLKMFRIKDPRIKDYDFLRH